jgi:hypothetical protein
MVARVQALTELEFDRDAVRSSTKPNVNGAVVDSTEGWLLDHTLPHTESCFRQSQLITAIS